MYLARSLLTTIMVLVSTSHAGEVANWWHLQRLRHQRFESFDDAIAAFPAELRDNVLPNFGTESPQHADFASPRTVLYSDDANLLIAIGGARGGRPSSNLMEAAEFNPLAGRYIPHLIRYVPETGRLVFVENVETVIPRGHPRHCARCHGEDFRPIFDSYNMWPQSYGSGLWRYSRSNERARWAEFSERHRKGYYAHLTGLDATIFELETANERLTHLLNANNERRIVRRLKHNPTVIRYAREIFALLASRGNRIDVSNYLSPDLKRAYDEALPRLRERITSATHENMRRKVARYLALTGAGPDPHALLDFDEYEERFYANLTFFMELAGVSMDEWPMTLAQGTYSFSDPTHPLEQLTYEFYEHVLTPNYPHHAKRFRFRQLGERSRARGSRTSATYPVVKLHVEDEVEFNRSLVNMIRDSSFCEGSLAG